jgi:hypothetical protein
MADSFASVRDRAATAATDGEEDDSPRLGKLDPRQRKALELFQQSDTITSRDIEKLFSLSQRAARNILAGWVERGFLVVADPAKKSRKYALAAPRIRGGATVASDLRSAPAWSASCPLPILQCRDCHSCAGR